MVMVGTGGSVTVNVGGTNVLTGSTLGSGYGPATFNFTVYQGQSITVNYTAGSWSSENYYRVFNAANGGGTQLFQSTQYATPPASQAITNGCTSPMPACTGTPTPGNTNATYTAVPVGGTTILSVQSTYPLCILSMAIEFIFDWSLGKHCWCYGFYLYPYIFDANLVPLCLGMWNKHRYF